MHTTHRLVDGMLTHTVYTLHAVEGLLQIVQQRLIVQATIVLAVQVLQVFHLFYICKAHKGSQIEIEGRNGLSAVHFVLSTLQ